MTLPAANTTSDTYLYADDDNECIGVFPQSPLATLLYTIDYSDWLNTGETITSGSIGVSPAGPTASAANTVTVSSNANSGLSFLLGGGTEGTSYQVTISALTSIGQTKIDVLTLLAITPNGVGVATLGY